MEGDADEEKNETTRFGNKEVEETQVHNEEEGEGAKDSLDLEDEAAIFRKANLRRPTTKYRESTLGKSLETALQELHIANKMSSNLCGKVMCQFDRTIVSALSQAIMGKVAFKADKLKKYKFFENMWKFDFNDVEFRDSHCFANVSRLRILAFNGSSPLEPQKMIGGKRRFCGQQPRVGHTEATTSKTSAEGHQHAKKPILCVCDECS